MKGLPPVKRPERIIAAALSVLFCLVAAAAAVRIWVRAPEVPPAGGEDSAVLRLTEVEADAQDAGTDSAQDAAPVRERKPSCYLILLSGLDDDNGGSDTNILVRFDAGNRTIDLVSLPRDTLLHHEWPSNKLNFAYAKGGTALLREEVSNLLGVPVDFSVTINLAGFAAVIDQIGGVDFDVPANMDYDDPAQDLHIHIPKGMQHLSGSEALKVVRWRKNNDGSAYAAADLGRIVTQQNFLNEAAKQLAAKVSIGDVPALVEIFNRYVKTDLPINNLAWFGEQALEIGVDRLQYYMLPGDGAAWYRRESVYALDAEKTLALVNSALNPYTTPLTAEDLDILVP